MLTIIKKGTHSRILSPNPFVSSPNSRTFAPAIKQTRCSAVGSVPGLGPGGRPFESGRPDNKTKALGSMSKSFLFSLFYSGSKSLSLDKGAFRPLDGNVFQNPGKCQSLYRYFATPSRQPSANVQCRRKSASEKNLNTKTVVSGKIFFAFG